MLIHGTSSWSEKSWVGPFYPDGTQPRDYLALYAEQFAAVEADTTYYGIPRESTVRGWAERTPEGFVLCAKFPRSIVHGGEGRTPDRDVVLVPDRVGAQTESFLKTMSLLGPKCGPMVLQFPYFNKQAFEGPGEFLERLDVYLGALPKEFRYAVELRNKWWVKEPLLHILRRHDVAFVLSELAFMPHPAELAEKLDLITTDFVYARLIGDRKAVEEKTKTFDQLVLDRTSSLERWAELLRDVVARERKVYVFANNHYAGFAPATIRQLAELVTA
jgi:uncharacterized protein YecE (DUF72 family)